MLINLDYLLTLWNIVRGFCLLGRQKRQCPWWRILRLQVRMGCQQNFTRNFFIFSAAISLTWSIFFFFFFFFGGGGGGELTPSQRQYLITLICKYRDFHFFLRFWCPISLLNVDNKIVSKSLSLRLKKALPFVVGPDQTCVVAGRSNSDNVHLFRNVFDFVEQ